MSAYNLGTLKKKLFIYWFNAQAVADTDPLTKEGIVKDAFYSGVEMGMYGAARMRLALFDQRRALETAHASCVKLARETQHKTPPPLPPPHEDEMITEESMIQINVLHWAIKAFGPTAANRQERAARLVEEAIEVAQACELSSYIVERILQRVYQGEPGELAQELGGVMLTTMALAENASLSVEDCAQTEWRRVLDKPLEWWKEKHAAKVAAGTADLAPANPNDALRWICIYCDTVNAQHMNTCVGCLRERFKR